MRRDHLALGVVVFLAVLLAIVAARHVDAGRPADDAFALKSWVEDNDGAGRPWLDPTCYDDDHTAVGHASGWLNAGESWTFVSPRVVCHAKVQRGYLSFHQRLDAHVSIVDYGLHPISGDRFVQQARKTVTRAICNTDLGITIPGVNLPPGQLHVDLDPTGSEPGEPASAPTWTITAGRSGEYTLQMELDEPWWSGGESSIHWCLP